MSVHLSSSPLLLPLTVVLQGLASRAGPLRKPLFELHSIAVTKHSDQKQSGREGGYFRLLSIAGRNQGRLSGRNLKQKPWRDGLTGSLTDSCLASFLYKIKIKDLFIFIYREGCTHVCTICVQVPIMSEKDIESTESGLPEVGAGN